MRRFLRFIIAKIDAVVTHLTLRWLVSILVVLFLISLFLPHRKTPEEKFVALLSTKGVFVRRDHTLPEPSTSTHFRKPDRRPFASVGMSRRNTSITAEDVRELATFQSLRVVDFGDNDVTQAAFAELAQFKKINTIELTADRVTDRVLADLRETNLLHYLNVGSGQAILGVDTRPSKPEDLVRLDLSWTKVTDAGLKELASLKNLERLDLRGTAVSGEGLKELEPFKKLTILVLASTKVTDGSLKGLASLVSVRWLELENTKVTDAGMKELVPLKNLLRLNLKGTKVTSAGVGEARKENPKLYVEMPY